MKYLRRLLWFGVNRLVMFSVVIAILIVGFYLAMNTANIYVLLSEGMKLRANAILTREGARELNNFFIKDFLDADEALNIGLSKDDSPYIDYVISDFSYVLSLEWMWSWPWEDEARAVIVERVPHIAGSVVSEKKSLVTSGTLSANPPSWRGGRYNVTLVRINGRWKIAALEQTQIILEPTPTPSPTPAG